MEGCLAPVDLIVVSHNTRDLLLQCLQSIRENTPEPHQVFVVDNASADGSAAAVKALGRENVHVLENRRNRGYARACNQGLRAGNGPVAVLLNSDVLLTENWLRPLLRCLESDPRIAVAGPKMVDPQGRVNAAGVVGTNANHYPRGYLEPDRPGLYEETQECLSVCGACYAVKRSVLNRVGLMDENFFFYFEETDLSFRVRDKGYKVMYCPESKIVHVGGASCLDPRRLRAYFDESRRYFNRKWAGAMKAERDLNWIGGETDGIDAQRKRQQADGHDDRTQ